VLSLYYQFPGTVDNERDCNDDTNGLQAMLSFRAYPSQQYLIRLAGSGGTTGSYAITFSQAAAIAGTLRGANTTGADGTYRIPQLDPGTYFVATDDLTSKPESS